MQQAEADSEVALFSGPGIPWQKDEDVKYVLERLLLFHTVDDLAEMFKRTKPAIRRRCGIVGTRVRIRRTHKGGIARMWTGEERRLLLLLAESKTVTEAGRLMWGLSRHVLYQQMKTLGVKWGQGTHTMRAVATVAGVSSVTARKKAAQAGIPVRASGKGNGRRRYFLTDDQAVRLVGVLRPARVGRALELLNAA